MVQIYHALGLHMHQPLGNLMNLHQSDEPWEAKQILWCYDRVTRMLEGYADIPWLHMSFSGTLLKQFEDPAVHDTFRDIANIWDFLERYRYAPIEYVGSGLYHPVYPLTPPADWDAQTAWWLGLGRHLLGREHFPGFWPPELGFCMEMIPMLKRYGFRYVIVDCWYIKPKREMRWEEIRYRPHLASYAGETIIVIPRDRELSDAQESGIEPEWFEHELIERTKFCDFPPLVTTWTDGENGGWFRTPDIGSGFWGIFVHPTLNKYRAGHLGFTPIHISQYLDRHPPTEEVEVHPGAWNTGTHWGGDFMQWTGSLLQKKGWDEIRNASEYYHGLHARFVERRAQVEEAEEVEKLITQAYDQLLLAETSCNFYWGSHWVHRSFDAIEAAYRLLDTAAGKIPAVDIATTV